MSGNFERIRQRLADGNSCLERLAAEREHLGASEFGKAVENQVVWRELLDLELEDVDEQVRRISREASGAPPYCTQNSGESKIQFCAKEVLVDSTAVESLHVNSEELAILAELLESERARLLVEIRHTDHRSFREELRSRLNLVEKLAERCRIA